MSDANVPTPLVDVREAARLLGLGRSKVYDLMDTGQLRYVKLGRARRIELCELRRLVEDNRMGGTDQGE